MFTEEPRISLDFVCNYVIGNIIPACISLLGFQKMHEPLIVFEILCVYMHILVERSYSFSKGSLIFPKS